MRKSSLMVFVLFAYFSPNLSAQKLKYKDIFEIIQSGNWDEADKHLKIYLSDPKNAEDANANYNMGKSYERKVLALNIISDTSRLYTYVDSSNFYYNRALALIDEKELKKNDELYQEFNRRDLRTGEFGIKVSDVHLDIENKVKALDERRKNCRSFHAASYASGKYYKEAGELLDYFRKKFPTQQRLLLGFTKADELRLSELDQKADVFQKSVGAAQSALAAIPNAKFGLTVSPEPLRDIASFEYSAFDLTDGGSASHADILAWTAQTRNDLRSKAMPLLDELIAYDRDLDAKKQSGNVGQVVLNEDLMGNLRSFIVNSLAEKVLTYKVEELAYLAATGSGPVPDSTQIDEMYKRSQALANRLGNMSSLLSISRQEAEQGFIETPIFFESRYVSVEKLLSYAAERKLFVEQEQTTNMIKVGLLESRRKWLSTASSDSIPLLVSDSIVTLLNYQTLLVADSAGLFAAGLKGTQKELFMFVAKASPSYAAEWLMEEKLLLPDKGFVFKPSNAGMIDSNDGFRAFYVFYPLKGKTRLFAATLSEAGVLLWKVSLDLDRSPERITFNKTVSETIIYISAAAGSTATDLSYVVIDKGGKVRKSE